MKSIRSTNKNINDSLRYNIIFLCASLDMSMVLFFHRFFIPSGLKSTWNTSKMFDLYSLDRILMLLLTDKMFMFYCLFGVTPMHNRWFTSCYMILLHLSSTTNTIKHQLNNIQWMFHILYISIVEVYWNTQHKSCWLD